MKRKPMSIERRAWMAADYMLSGTDNASELRKSWYRAGYRKGVKSEQRRQKKS